MKLIQQNKHEMSRALVLEENEREGNRMWEIFSEKI